MSSKDDHKNNLKKIAYAGVLAALVFVGTELHIPTAIGSTLADLLAGLLLKRSRESKTSFIRKFSASLIAELIMITGYFAFESLPFMYGVEAALGSVIPNGIQASAAIVGAVPLMYVKFFDKYQLSKSSEVHKRNEKTAVS